MWWICRLPVSVGETILPIMSDENFQDEVSASRSGIWIWLLIGILFVLLLVPVVSIALAVQRTEWIPLRKQTARQPLQAPVTAQGAASADHVLSLRDRVEQLASSFIKTPQLRTKMEQVRIGSASPTAPFSVREILQSRHHQFVEAVDKDRVRIVVILPSKEWSELSTALQAAAQKDGFLYSGPQTTSSSDEDSESMVAEIEIVRNGQSGGSVQSAVPLHQVQQAPSGTHR
jgi:hypothetical protein